MSDTDSVTDAVQSIRVSRDYTGMSILELEEPETLGWPGRLSYIGILDPAEPLTLTNLTRSIRILGGFIGILETIAFPMNALEGGYPELVFRPAVPPVLGPTGIQSGQASPSQVDSSAQAPGSESKHSTRTDRRTGPSARTGDRPQMPVAGHRTLRRVSQTSIPGGPASEPSSPMEGAMGLISRVDPEPSPSKGEPVRPPVERPTEASESGPLNQQAVRRSPSLHPILPQEPEPRDTTRSDHPSAATSRQSAEVQPAAKPFEMVRTADEPPGSADTKSMTPAEGERIRGASSYPAPPSSAVSEGAVGQPERFRPPMTVPIGHERAGDQPGSTRTSRRAQTAVELILRHESFPVTGIARGSIRRGRSSVGRRTPSPRGRSPPSPRTSSKGTASEDTVLVGTPHARDRARAGPRSLAARQVPLSIQRRRASEVPESGRPGVSTAQGPPRESSPPSSDVAPDDGDSLRDTRPAPTRAITEGATMGPPIERQAPLTIYRLLSASQHQAGPARGPAGVGSSSRESRRPLREFQSPMMGIDTDPGKVSTTETRPGDTQVDRPRHGHPTPTELSVIGPRRPGIIPTVATRMRPESLLTRRSPEGALDREPGRDETGLHEASMSTIRPSITGDDRGPAPIPAADDTGGRRDRRFPLVSIGPPARRERELSQVPPIRSRAMPTLLMRDNGGGTPRGRERKRRRSQRLTSDVGGRQETGTDESTGSARDRSGRQETKEPRIQPTVIRSEPSPMRDGRVDRPSRGVGSRGRNEPTGLYADFSFKSLAPRVDVTPRADATRGQPAHGEVDDRRRDPISTGSGIEELLTSGDLDRVTSSAEVDSLVERLKRGLDRRRRIDRERRGL